MTDKGSNPDSLTKEIRDGLSIDLFINEEYLINKSLSLLIIDNYNVFSEWSKSITETLKINGINEIYIIELFSKKKSHIPVEIEDFIENFNIFTSENRSLDIVIFGSNEETKFFAIRSIYGFAMIASQLSVLEFISGDIFCDNSKIMVIGDPILGVAPEKIYNSKITYIK